MDEATSAVDTETDAAIQRAIREDLPDATLLVIAHRLTTVADFDHIVVLDHGKVAEEGAPSALWARRGPFRAMCDESGDQENLRVLVGGLTA